MLLRIEMILLPFGDAVNIIQVHKVIFKLKTQVSFIC